MSAASTMARMMQHYMIKSSAGMFRARLVVSVCDWTKILIDDDDDDDDYDTPAVNGNAGRTRLCDGVIVTELAGPRNSKRVLCVTALTASLFVNVLHRLLCGFAEDKESVAIKLLVSQVDFESAASGNGRGGIRAVFNELRRAAAVHISDGFERFHVYPTAGETAIHIVGRPSAVVHCVCLINELLCEAATAAAVRLVAADRRPLRRREDEAHRPASTSRPNNFGWSIFTPLDGRNSPSSPNVITTYWPAIDPRPNRHGWNVSTPHVDRYLTSNPTFTNTNYLPTDNHRPATPIWSARLGNQYSPSSPTDTNSDWPEINPRPATPVWSARLANQYSPSSPTDTNSDLPEVNPRPATPIWGALLDDQYSPLSPSDTDSDWSGGDSRPVTPILWSASERLLDQYSLHSYNNTIVVWPVAGLRPTTPTWNDSERFPDENSPQSPTNNSTDLPVTDPRPATLRRSALERFPDQYSPQSPTNNGTNQYSPQSPTNNGTNQYSPQSPTNNGTNSPVADPRPATLRRSALERFPDQYSPQSLNNSSTNSQVADPRSATLRRSALERLPDQYSPQSPTNTMTDSPAVNNRPTCITIRYVNGNQSPRLATTTAATRPTISIQPIFDQLIVNRQPSRSHVTTNSTTTTDVTTATTEVTTATTDATTATTSTTVSTTATTGQSSSESRDSSQYVP